MTTYPGSPKMLRGGIVLIDPESGAVQRTITLQYNPESLKRSLKIKGIDAEGGDRSEALRLTGPATESISLEADLDATDQLEFPDQNPDAVQSGIHPQLAALETLVNPSSRQLQSNLQLAQAGTLEIVPMETPLSIFVYGKSRIVPVRITELSFTEEAFDPNLNPIRAKVSLGLQVLSVDDLGFDHRGGSLFMSYLQQKETLAAKNPNGSFADLGIGGIS